MNLEATNPSFCSHSKLVKRGTINICLKNVLHKSCFHLIKNSFKNRVLRLVAAGFPSHLLTAVAATLLKRRHIESDEEAYTKNRNITESIVPTQGFSSFEENGTSSWCSCGLLGSGAKKWILMWEKNKYALRNTKTSLYHVLWKWGILSPFRAAANT